MPSSEEIYQNAPAKSSKVKIPWREPGQLPQRSPYCSDNQHSTSCLESKGMNRRCNRTNILLVSLCVLLLCGITVLSVLYAIEKTSQQPSNTGSSSGPCPNCWDFFNGSCYYFSHDKLNWTASRDECVSAGGHLVVIDNREEQIYITQKIIHSEDGFWIGLTDFEREGHWTWVDNTELRLKFWYKGQPNNKQHGADNKDTAGEDCGLVRDVSQEQNWYDEYCGAFKSRVCETKSVKSKSR